MYNGDESATFIVDGDQTTQRWFNTYEMSNALKPQDAHSSVETRASTKSPNSGVDAEEYQLMDELVDAEALASSMHQGQMRLPIDAEAYGSYNMAGCAPMSPTGYMAPTSPMGQQVAMEMPGNMPMQMIPSNAPVMYADMSMQQAGPQVQMMMGQAPMPGNMPGQGQYVMQPMMMPVRMVPVPMPMSPTMQMGAQVPQQAGYYLVPDAAEQNVQRPPASAEAEAPKNFLESLMPTGWRKRQRPSKRPAARMQKVPSGRKIFVGGLSPNSTAESLISHFSEYGKISDASVIHEAVTRRSRGFGYVEFVDKIPDGLLDMDHYIDQRRCGVRGYNYDPEDPPTSSQEEEESKD
jgi:hypothetical protein